LLSIKNDILFEAKYTLTEINLAKGFLYYHETDQFAILTTLWHFVYSSGDKFIATI